MSWDSSPQYNPDGDAERLAGQFAQETAAFLDGLALERLAADFSGWVIRRTQHPDGTPDRWAATAHGAGTLTTCYAHTAQDLRETLARPDPDEAP